MRFKNIVMPLHFVSQKVCIIIKSKDFDFYGKESIFMGLKVFSALLLALGIVSLIVCVLLFLTSDSSLRLVLMVLSIISNVAGISILSSSSSKNRKK